MDTDKIDSIGQPKSDEVVPGPKGAGAPIETNVPHLVNRMHDAAAAVGELHAVVEEPVAKITPKKLKPQTNS